MSNETIQLIEFMAKEYGIERETLVGVIEEALCTAARKTLPQNRELEIQLNQRNGSYTCTAKLFVVAAVTDPASEIALETARERYPEAVVGDEVEWDVPTDGLGRIAAQVARQVIVQRVRDEKRKSVCEVYREQIGQLVNGIVKKIDHNEIIIGIGNAEGALRFQDKIPGESYDIGDHVTALLVDVNQDKPGASLNLSRITPDFVRRLFEREVTEINSGMVEIKGIAREAGYRTKIAVWTEQSRIDPVGACVGLRGTRVKTIVKELAGEKVDIVNWDPDIRTFVANALKPARYSTMEVVEESHQIKIKVPEDQLSLAIGRKGQNARLAAKLVGWRIDISRAEVAPPSQPESNFQEQVRQAVGSLSTALGINEDTAQLLVNNGFASLDGIIVADIHDLAEIEGIGPELANQIFTAALNASN